MTHGQIEKTMKRDHRCPKCESGQLWLIREARMRDPRFSNIVRPIHVMAANFDPHRMQVDTSSSFEVGTFEVWICAECGFTEWYANGVNEALADLSRFPETGVLFFNGHPRRNNPYRSGGS